jgi:hypothetical protein
MTSNCCGAEPSYLSDERCGDCLEWAEFDEEDEEDLPMGETCRNGKQWAKCDCC